MTQLREDVVLCIDTSQSMYRKDYYPSRLEAAKKAALEFVVEKNKIDPNDRMAIVIFADMTTVKQDLTADVSTLQTTLKTIKAGGLSKMDAGLSSSLSILRREMQTSRHNKTWRIILLSDGRPYGASKNPLDIAKKARKLQVFIDTIGIGNKGSRDFEESLLKRLATETNGEYMYVTDTRRLLRAFIGLAPKKIPRYQGRVLPKEVLKIPPEDVSSLLSFLPDKDYWDAYPAGRACNICFQWKCPNPVCQKQIWVCVRYCPHCSKPMHLHCALKNASISPSGIFPCPSCSKMVQI